jgi:cyclase
MIFKRIIGVITIKNGLAVQSFGYKNYLPLGNPVVLAENLDRWGVDEIYIKSIDRTRFNLGPDFDLLEKIGKKGLSTPVIYGGGISSLEDALNTIKSGADRITIDALLWNNPEEIKKISTYLGSQAVILAIPIIYKEKIYIYNYISGKLESFENNPKVYDLINGEYISEVMAIDFNNEGYSQKFDKNIYLNFPKINKPLILFGGISNLNQFEYYFSRDNISAIGLGNFLNYKEQAVDNYKKMITGGKVRLISEENL